VSAGRELGVAAHMGRDDGALLDHLCHHFAVLGPRLHVGPQQVTSAQMHQPKLVHQLCTLQRYTHAVKPRGSAAALILVATRMPQVVYGWHGGQYYFCSELIFTGTGWLMAEYPPESPSPTLDLPAQIR